MKLLGIVFGCFTLQTINYITGFLLRHKTDYAPAYQILLTYIFGYLTAEIHVTYEKELSESSVLVLGLCMLLNPFIFLIWMPRIPQFYKPDYYGWGLQTSLVLCAFNLIWGLILLRVLVWLVEYDLLKIKTTEDRKFKM